MNKKNVSMTLEAIENVKSRLAVVANDPNEKLTADRLMGDLVTLQACLFDSVTVMLNENEPKECQRCVWALRLGPSAKCSVHGRPTVKPEPIKPLSMPTETVDLSLTTPDATDNVVKVDFVLKRRIA